MQLFENEVKKMPFLKASVYGFTGSGKTLTGSQIAIGLHKYLKLDSPVFFVDTESGTSFVGELFERSGIKLLPAYTRSFVDLLACMDEAEKNGQIIMIDSITHFWQELMSAYKKKKGKTRINVNDIGIIKEEWAPFTKRYLTSKLHVLMLGRAADDLQEHMDEEGIKQLTNMGTKMSCEKNLGYEPFLSIEMLKERMVIGQAGGRFKHKMWITKDKHNVINGLEKTFLPIHSDKIDLTENNPCFQFIFPHIQKLAIGTEHNPIANTSSMELFNSDKSMENRVKRHSIALEELEDQIKLSFPGSDAESRKTKIEALQSILGTSSWTAIQGLSVEKLISAKESIKQLKGKEPNEI